MTASVASAWSPEERVIWHDLECGGYAFDLPLWLELAAAAPGPSVLDVGCGTGRVALPLARAGHQVTAVDVDATLLAQLAVRAAPLPVEVLCGDARDLDLASRDFGLCVTALQTIQLLGGAEPRARFLAAARGHLRAGGILACAIAGDLRSYSLAAGEEAPPADHVRRDGRVYISHATAMRVEADTIEVERRRRVIGEGGRRDLPEREALEVLRLARVSALQLEHEGRDAGLTPLPRRTIAERDGFLGSEVVLLGA